MSKKKVIPEATKEETPMDTETNRSFVAKPSSARETTPSQREKETNESFLGGVLIFALTLSLLAALGYFGYIGYRSYQAFRREETIPSIETMAPIETAPLTNSEEQKTSVSKEETQKTPAVSEGEKKTLAIKVLNGGAAKGSAGRLTELLRQAGFAKAVFGNSRVDHTGTVIYYGDSFQAAAELIKAVVIHTYPQATLAPSQTNVKDTSVAPIVIILGKEK